MPERLFLALIVAATCWSLVGNEGFGAPDRSSTTSGQEPYSGSSNVVIPVAVPVGTPTAGSPASGSGGPVDPNRKLQTGDQLLVKIEEDREAPLAVAVSGAGEITIDPLPPTIKIGGLTVSQAAGEIKRVLERDYYQSATVRLMLERASIPPVGYVYVSGHTAFHGRVPLFADRPMTVSEVIVSTGGLGHSFSEGKVRLTRVGKDGLPQSFTIDVKAVINEGKVDRDMVVQNGDKIDTNDNFFKPN